MGDIFLEINMLGNQHVTFAFPQSTGIYYQNNKGYIAQCYLL